MQSIFPNLVSTSSPTSLTPDGTLGLNYIGLIAPLVRAVQALSATISGFAVNFVSAHIVVTTMDAGTANIQTANIQNLCMGGVCITPAQFEAVFGKGAQSGGGAAAAGGSQEATPPAGGVASSTQISGDSNSSGDSDNSVAASSTSDSSADTSGADVSSTAQ